MKSNKLKHILFALSFLVSMGHAGLASAHFIFFATVGAGPGAPNGAVDVVSINCPPPSVQLDVRVSDFNGDNNFITTTVLKNTADSATDPTGGDPLFSAFASVSNGSGPYTVITNHSGTGQQTYNLEFHCRDANNGEPDPVADPVTGDDFTVIQDQ